MRPPPAAEEGSKKEWQQHGDWQVPLDGTQTEPMLQQELLRGGVFANGKKCKRVLYGSKAKILPLTRQDFLNEKWITVKYGMK